MNLLLNEQKNKIRTQNKATRATLDIKKLSIVIMDKVVALDEFKNSDAVFCYISFGNELDTSKILNFPNKRIFVPKVIGNEMYMTKYTPQNLRAGKFGIPEPAECTPVTPSKNDVIIVPALACDKKFFRLGYGKGFYDRFMKNSEAVKILPIPSVFVTDNIPHDENDIKTDIIVTENSVLKRNENVTKNVF